MQKQTLAQKLLIVGVCVLIFSFGYFTTAKYIFHTWPYQSASGQQPPSFWKDQALKGSFVETQGFLKFEESDKKTYSYRLPDLKEQYKTPTNIKAGVNYMFTNAATSVANIIDGIDPVAGQLLLVYYSPGEGGLDAGFYTYPKTPIQGAIEIKPNNTYSFTIPANRVVIIIAKNATTSYGLLSANDKPSNALEAAPLTNAESGWVLVASREAKLADTIKGFSERVLSAWPLQGQNDFPVSVDPASYTFSDNNIVWLQLAQKKTNLGNDTTKISWNKITGFEKISEINTGTIPAFNHFQEALKAHFNPPSLFFTTPKIDHEGHMLAFGALDLNSPIFLYDYLGKLIRKIVLPTGEAYYTSPAPSANGKKLFVLRIQNPWAGWNGDTGPGHTSTASEDFKLHILDAATGEESFNDDTLNRDITGYSNIIVNNKILFSKLNTYYIYDLFNNKLITKFEIAPIKSNNVYASLSHISSDGEKIFIIQGEGESLKITILDMTGKILQEMASNSKVGYHPEILDDDTMLAMGTSSGSGYIAGLDMSGKEKFRIDNVRMGELHTSPDGKYFIMLESKEEESWWTGGMGETPEIFRLYDTSGKKLFEKLLLSVDRSHFEFYNNTIKILDDNGLHIFNFENHEELMKVSLRTLGIEAELLPPQGWKGISNLSASGKELLISNSKETSVYDVESGKVLYSTTASLGDVIGFTPNGDGIITKKAGASASGFTIYKIVGELK